MRKFLNLFLTFLAIYLLDGVTDAHADPISGAILAITKFVTGLGIVGKILLSGALMVGQTLLQKAFAKKPAEQPIRGVELQVRVGDDLPVTGILGTYATAGKRKYIGVWGKVGKTPNAYLVDVIEISNIPVGSIKGLWINDIECTLQTDVPAGDGLGFAIPEFISDNDDYAWWHFFTGEQILADPYLMAKFGAHPERPWKSTMINRYGAYIVLTYRQHEQMFPSLPSALVVTDGYPMYDVRKDSTAGGSGPHRRDDQSTWEPSDNPWVQAYAIAQGITVGGRWFYGGQNVSMKRLPTSAWIAAMNACDAERELEDGSFEPMFRSGIEFRGEDEPLKVLDYLRAASNGRLVEIGGKLKPFAGEPGAAEMAFTDADIVITKGQSFEPFPNLDDTHNGATATYPEPSEKWTNKDAPPFYNTDFEEADGGRRLIASLSFPAVPYPVQVQALIRAAIEEARRFRVHQFWLPPLFWAAEPGDVLSWTSQTAGYVNKKMLVVTIEGELAYNQLVTLREIEPADYSWSPTFQVPAPTTTPGPVVLPSQPIAGLSITASAISDNDSADRRPSVLVAVANDLDGVKAIRVQIRVKTTQELIYDLEHPYVVGKTYSWNIGSAALIGGEDYEVAAIIVPTTPRPVVWSNWVTITMFPLLIGDKDILDDSVTSAKIKDGAVTASKIMDEAVTNLKLANEAVSTAKLQIASVTQNILADNSVIASKLADGSVSFTKFASGIEPVSIVPDASPLPTVKTTNNITWQGALYTWNATSGQYETPTFDIADGSITAEKLANAAVTAEKLANAAVTHDKLSAGSVYGDVIAAQSITARELTLVDFSNIVDLGYDRGDFSAWAIFGLTGSGQELNPTSPVYGSYVVGTNQRDGIISNNFVSVSEGETYYFSAWNYNPTANGTNIYAFGYAGDKSTVLIHWQVVYQPPGNTDYVQLQGRWTIPAGSGVRYVRMVLQTDKVAGSGGDPVWWARPVMRRAANAELIVDGSVTAIKVAANAITADKLAANSVIAGKIAAAAVSTAELAAGAVTTDKLAVGVGSNFLVNSDFAAGGIYWGLDWTNAPEGTWSIGMRYDTYGAQPYGSMELYYNGSDPTVVVGMGPKTSTGEQKKFPCVAGDWYEFSTRYLGHRCRAIRLYFGWFNKDGTIISYSVGEFPAEQNSDPQFQLANYQQAFFKAQAPAGATSFYIIARNDGPAAGQWAPYLWLSHLYLGKATASQTQPTPWSDGSATLINGGVISALSIQAVSIAAAAITAEKLAANSVTAAAIAASTITGDKIAANTIGSDKIIANSITARELLLTDFSNMVGNGFDQGSLSGWWTEGQQGYYPESNVGASTGGWILQSNARNCAINTATFAVTPGETYYYETWVYNVGGNPPAGILLVGVRGDYTSPVYPNHLTNVTDAWVRIQGRYTIEPNISKLRFVLFCDKSEPPAGPSTYFTKPILRRASGAELIVDGAITADKIAANAITAGKIAAGSITADKMNVATLSAISATLGNVDISNANIGTLTVGTSNIQPNAATAMEAGDGYNVSFTSSFKTIAAVVLEHGPGNPKVTVDWAVLGPGVAVEYRVLNYTTGYTMFTYSFAATMNNWSCLAQDVSDKSSVTSSTYLLQVRSAQAGSFTHPFAIIRTIALKR